MSMSRDVVSLQSRILTSQSSLMFCRVRERTESQYTGRMPTSGHCLVRAPKATVLPS